MATTADTIATGDLSHRADLPRDGSEVGRLGTAFNRMLDQIEGAFGQQRAALDAKDRSERRLRQFVADASHELRTPLTAVRGYAELYRAGGLSEREALDRAMSRIETESRRMAVLVDDLLLLARLDQGRPLRRDPVDLSELVRDAVADARMVEPERPLQATVADGVLLPGDEDRLRQVVGNLFANVRVHTPPDTPVEVTLGVGAEGATVRVADHGPGIPEEHADRVFDRFFRADPGRSRDRGGSGLGLAIAASVVEAHGGSVHHEPTPGGGATFVVTLPLGDPGSGPDERRRPADRPAPGRDTRLPAPGVAGPAGYT
jgi:two-component system OmpR family sensor kinase